MGHMLLLKLLKFVAVSDPNNITLLGPTILELHPGVDWTPCRVGSFVEPRRFNDDKEDLFWCLLSKAEALSLLRDWHEDPQYSEEPKPNGQNYFKNTVDNFEHKMENRKW